MKKYLKPLILVIVILTSLRINIISISNNVLDEGMANLLKSNSLELSASVVIVMYLLFKLYQALSSDNKKNHSIFWLLLLPITLTVNLISDISLVTELPFQYAILLRLFLVLSFAVTADVFLKIKVELKAKVSVILIFIVCFSITFMLNQTSIAKVIVLFYCVVSIYFIYLFAINKYSEKDIDQYILENVMFLLIAGSLLNDASVIISEKVSMELFHISVSIIIILFAVKELISKLAYIASLEQFKKSNANQQEFMKNEIKKNKKAYEKLKNDLSYRYSERQSYYENLEFVLEASDLSIIIINSSFIIEMAQGLIVESSDLDDLVGQDITHALVDISSDAGLYFKSVVRKVFDAEDSVREKLYTSLLEKNLAVNNIVFELKYDIVRKMNNEKILIIRAEKKISQNSKSLILIQEKEVSDMLLSIVRNSEMFYNDLSSYLEFCKNISDLIEDDIKIKDNVFKVLRRVHTYKGVFDQYNMTTLISGLNDIENELLNILQNIEGLTNLQFKKIVEGYELETLLNYEISVIQDRLGKSFLENKNNTSVDLTAFNKLYEKLSLRLNLPEDASLLKEYERLKEVDVKKSLLAYKQYVQRIANEQEKLINFIVVGDDVTVDRMLHINFFEGLIHILKNCVAHGIEYPDERRSLNKIEHATIKCEVKKVDSMINIRISDDGRGIDVKEIRNRLFILGKHTIDELEQLPNSDICNMIIEDGITSQTSPNSLAGKGVGMGCIREIVQEIKGSINVSSKMNEGVVYDIFLPLDSNSINNTIDYNGILASMCIQVERVLTRTEKKEKISSRWTFKNKRISYKDLLDCSVKVVAKGYSDVSVIISADEKFLMQLVDLYKLPLKYKGANIKILNEALSRFSNEIIKRMAAELKGIRETIKIEAPIILTEESIENKYSKYESKKAEIQIKEGRFMIQILENSGLEVS